MFPTICSGSLIRVHPIKSGNIRRGNIIVFVQSDTLVAHRIVSTTDNSVITQGDSVLRPDQAIPFSQIVGYVDSSPLFGRLFLFLSPILRPINRLFVFVYTFILHQKRKLCHK